MAESAEDVSRQKLSVGMQIGRASLLWIGACGGPAVVLGFAFAAHMGDFVEMVSTGLIFAAVGAVGDAGYLTVSKNWKQSRWPRWMLVGFWTSLVAPTLVAVIALARQYTGVTESFLLVMIVGTFPAFITAFLTSQLPTTTADPFTQ